MKLQPWKSKRIVAVCCECEDRSDGPKHLDSKSVVKMLRRASIESPVRTRMTRVRCLGLCPHKALAAVVLGEGLTATSAEMQDEDDVKTLARYAFGPSSKKN